MSKALDFGVQSFCFRNFKDNNEVAKMVKEIGVSSIEICAIHADFNDIEGWKKIVDIYKNEGIDIVSIGVQTFNGAEEERNWFECAKIAGAKHISAHFSIKTYLDAIPKTVALCEEFDINIGIHTHGGYMFAGSRDVLTHLLELGGKRIGLNIDTAWVLQTGRDNNPIDWVSYFSGRIYGVHYKDFTFNQDASWQDVIVGTGNLDLPGFVNALDNDGFNGMAVIEYEADVENPVPALTECVNKMRELTPSPV